MRKIYNKVQELRKPFLLLPADLLAKLGELQKKLPII